VALEPPAHVAQLDHHPRFGDTRGDGATEPLVATIPVVTPSRCPALFDSLDHERNYARAGGAGKYALHEEPRLADPPHLVEGLRVVTQQ